MSRQQEAIAQELEEARKRISELECRLAAYQKSGPDQAGTQQQDVEPIPPGSRGGFQLPVDPVATERLSPSFTQGIDDLISVPISSVLAQESPGSETAMAGFGGSAEGSSIAAEHCRFADAGHFFDWPLSVHLGGTGFREQVSAGVTSTNAPSALQANLLSSLLPQEVLVMLLHTLQGCVALYDFATLDLIAHLPGGKSYPFCPLDLAMSDEMLLTIGFQPDDLSQVRGVLEKCCQGESCVAEVQYRNDLNHVAWYEMRVQPIRNSDGTTCLVLLLTRDITRRKERELLLREQRNRAENASQAKSDFLANMSHEIRTPLNGILGMLDLLGSTGLTKRQRRYIELAATSGDNLLDLINDILDFSKIEARKYEAHEQHFLLAETIETTVSMFAKQAKEKDVALSSEVDSSVPAALYGDDAKLRQILLNLLGNAVKFTPRGSISLTVNRLLDPAPDEVRLLFTIVDTGVGIGDDKIDLVFEEFAQVGDSYTRMYAGTGLGLGIVKRLVAMLGGGIVLESDTGVGTTIYFTIRMKQADSERVRREQPLCVRQAEIEPLTILLAEDDHINRVIGGSMLENMGHSVVYAENGLEVMQILEGRTDIDCILMDIQMPEMDGVEASKAIRHEHGREENGSRIPIIALTAHALSGDREKFMAAGMDEYITKPYRAEDLYAVLAQVQTTRQQQ